MAKIIDFSIMYFDTDSPAKDHLDEINEGIKGAFYFAKQHKNAHVYNTTYPCIVGSSDNDNFLLFASDAPLNEKDMRRELKKVFDKIYTEQQEEGYDSLFEIDSEEYKEFLTNENILNNAIKNVEKLQ